MSNRPEERKIKMKSLSPNDFICLNDYATEAPFRVHLDYAHDDNLAFGERIYKTDATLWAYKPLGELTLQACKAIHRDHGLHMVIYDCLRTTTAQEKMLHTKRVKDNPHWLEEPRLLSPPGAGGHPRGMAIDISLETADGVLLDMGTPFDYLSEDSSPETNPAHREHPHLTQQVRANRKILDDAMMSAASALGIELLPLPQEWWDFRLPPHINEQFAPLSDQDFPKEMRCCED